MKKLTLIAIAFLMSVMIANATHIAGFEMTYECLGKNLYRIKCKFYRDCSGSSQMWPGQWVNFQATDCSSGKKYTSSLGTDFGKSFDMTQGDWMTGTGPEITPICPTEKTTCNGGTYYGLQEFIYEDTITLPDNCSDWIFDAQAFNRNPSTTSSNSVNLPLDVYVKLNNKDFSTCNNSPYYKTKPVTVFINNQQTCFNHGTIDADGDSLSYQFIAPVVYLNFKNLILDSSNFLPYNAGYSYKQFLTGPISIDKFTGDFCVYPNKTEVSPFAVLVREYRKDNTGKYKEIGYVVRDMNANVINSTNTVPDLSGMKSTTGYDSTNATYYRTAKPGEKIDFYFCGKDKDGANLLKIDTSSTIKGSTVTITGNNTSSPCGHFTWTPVSTDRSPTPKCFYATIKDNACPYFGQQTYGYCVKILGIGVTLSKDTLLCKGQTFTAVATGDAMVKRYYWEVDGVKQTVPTTTKTLALTTQQLTVGVHKVKVIVDDNSTANVGDATITVTVVDVPNITATDIGKCNSPNATLDAGPNPNGTYIWSANANSATTQSVTVTSSGTYTVTSYGDKLKHCPATKSLIVNLQGMSVRLKVRDSILCKGDTTTIFAYIQGSPAFYDWKVNGVATSPATTKFVFDSKNYNIGNNAVTIDVNTAKKDCPGSASTNVVILKIPSVDLPKDTTLCTSLSLNAGSDWADIKWTTPKGNITKANNVLADTTGSYSVTVYADTNKRCPVSDFVNVTIPPSPKIKWATDPITICETKKPAILDPDKDVNHPVSTTYEWSANANNVTTKTVSVSNTDIYKLTIYGDNQKHCPDSGQVSVTVIAKPILDLGIDACISNPVKIDAGSTGLGYEYKWKRDDVILGENTQTINVTETGQYYVTVTSSSTAQCYTTDSIHFDLFPDPNVKIGNDTLICKHNELTLNAHQSTPLMTYVYQWYNQDGIMGGSNGTSITIKGNEPGIKLISDINTFWVEVKACKPFYDTIIVRVDPCGIVIPNVITPNGDNYNDIFKVENIEKYPKSLMRIYNRWGNKVYEHADYQNTESAAWNGKGHSDGVYYYVLDLSDGSTYHGTVTVIGKN